MITPVPDDPLLLAPPVPDELLLAALAELLLVALAELPLVDAWPPEPPLPVEPVLSLIILTGGAQLTASAPGAARRRTP